MRSVRRHLAVLLGVLLAFLGLVAAPSSAGVTDGTASSQLFSPNAQTVLELGVFAEGAEAVSPGVVPDWLRRCETVQYSKLGLAVLRFRRVVGSHGNAPDEETWPIAWTEEPPEVEEGQPPRILVTDPDEVWYVTFCPASQVTNANGRDPRTGIQGAWCAGCAVPGFVMEILIAQAYSELEVLPPVPVLAPPGDADAPLIVQLPTWLFIPDTDWQPATVTVSIPGAWATATATPYQVEFTNDEGGSIDCGDNVGAAYNFNLSDEQQDSACTLTYRQSSALVTAPDTKTLAQTVRWRVRYTCSQCAGEGTYPDFVVTATGPVVVAELQALGVANPGE